MMMESGFNARCASKYNLASQDVHNVREIMAGGDERN